MDNWFFLIAVLVFTIIAMVTDLSTRKLPNWLTVPAFVAAIVFHTFTSGWRGLGLCMGGFAVGFGLLLVLWLIGGGGGGEVKLMGALGAWLGPRGAPALGPAERREARDQKVEACREVFVRAVSSPQSLDQRVVAHDLDHFAQVVVSSFVRVARRALPENRRSDPRPVPAHRGICRTSGAGPSGSRSQSHSSSLVRTC